MDRYVCEKLGIPSLSYMFVLQPDVAFLWRWANRLVTRWTLVYSSII